MKVFSYLAPPPYKHALRNRCFASFSIRSIVSRVSASSVLALIMDASLASVDIRLVLFIVGIQYNILSKLDIFYWMYHIHKLEYTAEFTAAMSTMAKIKSL
jgi:hypothetical protein